MCEISLLDSNSVQKLCLLTFKTSLGSIDYLLPIQCHTVHLNTRHSATEVTPITDLCTHSYWAIRSQA